jgi:DegV family protein with EDD domain
MHFCSIGYNRKNEQPLLPLGVLIFTSYRLQSMHRKDCDMLRIVMDTAGDLVEGWAEKYDVDLIPINIIYKDKTYLQGVDMQYEDFYRLVDEEDAIPSTSQPTPYQFLDFYRRIADVGDDILSIHVTEKLSGTMDSAKQAAEELKGDYNVIPFDSASGTLSMGMMCQEARQMDREGKPLSCIIDRLAKIRSEMELVFTVDSLKYASMSGRVKHLHATLASMLNVKPIIELKDGIIEIGRKVRSRSKSIDVLVETMKRKVGEMRVRMGVVHARAPDEGSSLAEKVKAQFNVSEVLIAELTISLAVHFGPGTLGILAYPVMRGLINKSQQKRQAFS